MLSMIVAASENDVIGKANALPWHLPRDLKNFKEVTTGNTVVMGRKTFESIFARLGKPLPNRKNVIVTQQPDFQAPECVVVHSLEEALEKTKGENVFVIGGEAVYRLALPMTDRLHLTRVHTSVDGDVKLPTINFSEWNLISEERWPKDEKNEFDATYQVYERKR
ncbi:dihydrofolate reductase [Patescibacteria group bacterium]|jgi:dihydrofolate reductase|nr:dihydrofolate reductase [Patescibacteria group bacterium]